jgi:tetratricopeptide (TPR) repeat protein
MKRDLKSVADKAQVVFEAALAAEEAGHSAKALRLYEQASVIDPDASHVRVRWASLLNDKGRWKDAIRVTRQLIKKRPRLSLAHRLIGRSYDELGRLAMAERAYKQSLAIKQCPITWVLLASVLGRRKRNEEAEECLRQALKVDPDYEEAHYNLGYIYRLKGKLKLAEKHLRRAIEIDRQYSLAYAELGQLLAGSGRNDRTRESVTLLRKAVGDDPTDGWSRAYLANGLWTLGRLKAAEEQYCKLMELWPDRSVSYWCYGDFLAYKGKDISLAESYLRKALELDPRDEVNNYHLGKHLLFWGRPTEAKQYLRKAARLGHSKAQQQLRDLEGRRGGGRQT